MIDYERYVLEALQKAVIAVGLTIPVKYIGRVFNPPSDGKWLELIYIPNNGTNEYWSEGKTYRGLMRLILHWPMNSTGAYPAMDVARTIAASFVKGSKFSDTGKNVVVTITEHPNVQDVLEEAPDLLVPLTIRYSCFKV